MKAEIELGQKIRDKVSGIEGIAVARTEFLNGCVRITLQPKGKKDGTLPDEKWFDSQQLEVVGQGIKTTQRNTGGPQTRTPPKGLKA